MNCRLKVSLNAENLFEYRILKFSHVVESKKHAVPVAPCPRIIDMYKDFFFCISWGRNPYDKC